MSELACQNCVHFRQHYHLTETHGFLLDCGHCVYPRLKHRRAAAKICDHFEERSGSLPQPNRERTIRFLTTEILEMILKLELPPEISNENNSQ